MDRDRPTQAFAARDAHEALLELKKVVDDAAKTIHAAELELFHVAFSHRQNTEVRRTLQYVVKRLQSPDFDAVLAQVRDKLETAASI
jgi:hypothetical protein